MVDPTVFNIRYAELVKHLTADKELNAVLQMPEEIKSLDTNHDGENNHLK